MHSGVRSLKVAALAAVFAIALGGAQAWSAEDDAAVLAASDGFYVALNKLFTGEIEPMKTVWSHADDVTYMGPTGQLERGWAAILKDWEGQAAMKLGGKVEPSEIKVVVGGDLAVVTGYEVGENTNAKGKVEHLKLRASSVYRKEDGHWKMIGHQTDPLPYLVK